MDKPENDEISYMIKDKAENTDNLEDSKTDTAININNENNIKGIKKEGEDMRINCNTGSKELEVNTSSGMPEGIDNTITKHSWAEEAEKIDILGEFLIEDTEKSKIIEDLVKEKERLKTKLKNKDFSSKLMICHFNTTMGAYCSEIGFKLPVKQSSNVP